MITTEEFLKQFPSNLHDDFKEMMDYINIIKKKKHVPPHIIEFEGEKIYFYDELIKTLLVIKNENMGWYSKYIKKVHYTRAIDVCDEVRELLGVNALTNINILRGVKRGVNEIRVIYIGSFSNYRDSLGRQLNTSSLENNKIFKVNYPPTLKRWDGLRVSTDVLPK